MTSDSSYFIPTDMGLDGPFDRDGLCALIVNGVLKPDARLLGSTSKTVVSVEAIVPNAQHLYRRNCTSDRLIRTSSDRQRRVDERMRTPLSEPLDVPTAIPGAQAPVGTSTPSETRSEASDHQANLPSPARQRRLGYQALVFAILVVMAAMSWYLYLAPPGPTRYPPPDIDALTRDELATLPEDALLPRLEQECLRRMMISELPPLAAPSILSPTARHIWNLINGEGTLRSFGLQEQVQLARTPDPANASLLPQMIASYQAIGLDAPANLLGDAMKLPKIPEQFEIECLAAITRSRSSVAAYAHAHRDELFPDLTPAGKPMP